MADAQLPLMPSAGPGAVGARPPWAKRFLAGNSLSLAPWRLCWLPGYWG